MQVTIIEHPLVDIEAAARDGEDIDVAADVLLRLFACHRATHQATALVEDAKSRMRLANTMLDLSGKIEAEDRKKLGEDEPYVKSPYVTALEAEAMSLMESGARVPSRSQASRCEQASELALRLGQATVALSHAATGLSLECDEELRSALVGRLMTAAAQCDVAAKIGALVGEAMSGTVAWAAVPERAAMAVLEVQADAA